MIKGKMFLTCHFSILKAWQGQLDISPWFSYREPESKLDSISDFIPRIYFAFSSSLEMDPMAYLLLKVVHEGTQNSQIHTRWRVCGSTEMKRWMASFLICMWSWWREGNLSLFSFVSSSILCLADLVLRRICLCAHRVMAYILGIQGSEQSTKCWRKAECTTFSTSRPVQWWYSTGIVTTIVSCISQHGQRRWRMVQSVISRSIRISWGVLWI
jgi:hypothetical protein